VVDVPPEKQTRQFDNYYLSQVLHIPTVKKTAAIKTSVQQLTGNFSQKFF